MELLENQIGALIKNKKIVKNPINPRVIRGKPQTIRPIDDTASFACVGRLHPQSKGQDILLRALASDVWKARDWTLSLYGHGPQKIVLQQLVDALELQGKVLFMGHAADVSEIWARHDILLLPSRYEGMPLALIEAMVCGRPSVSTDVGDVRELVHEGVTGCLASAATTELYASALERMWNLRQKWPEMSVKSYEYIENWLGNDPAQELADLILAYTH